MEKLKLNVGDKFGEWTVIDTNRFSKNGHMFNVNAPVEL